MTNNELKEEFKYERAETRKTLDKIFELIGECNKSTNDVKENVMKVLEQTIKTNGRVTRLEERESESNKFIYQLKKETEGKIDDIRKETEVVRFYSKRPRLLRITITGFVVFVLFGAVGGIYNIIEKYNKIKSYVTSEDKKSERELREADSYKMEKGR